MAFRFAHNENFSYSYLYVIRKPDVTADLGGLSDNEPKVSVEELENKEGGYSVVDSHLWSCPADEPLN